MVATGINYDGDFYNIDPNRLNALLAVTRRPWRHILTDLKGPRDDRWYLSLMSPNTKGPQFAWLDPTSIYINAVAYDDLLDDLVAELNSDEIDVVAGLDAMGFVLGAAIGARLGRGFLPIRKAGKLCVDTDRVSYGNYSRTDAGHGSAHAGPSQEALVSCLSING